MKMVLAYVSPRRLDRVMRALERIDGFPGVTVCDARGFGREKLEDRQDIRAQLTDFTPTSRIEVLLPDAGVETVVEAIVEAAHTGKGGDGQVLVLPVDRAVRIRTKVPVD